MLISRQESSANEVLLKPEMMMEVIMARIARLDLDNDQMREVDRVYLEISLKLLALEINISGNSGVQSTFEKKLSTEPHILNICYGKPQYNHEVTGSTEPLSIREREILDHASMGKKYSEIATALNISLSTVKFHMRNVTNKLGVENAKQAIRISIKSESYSNITFN